MPEKELVGEVAHFYTKLSVAVIELSGKLKVGDKISIEGATTDLQQSVGSMEIEHEKVEEAEEGKSIGLMVEERVRKGDKVYKVIEG